MWVISYIHLYLDSGSIVVIGAIVVHLVVPDCVRSTYDDVATYFGIHSLRTIPGVHLVAYTLYGVS